MRVAISVDMEGISGIVSSKEIAEKGIDYKRAQEWITADTNAAVEGALEAGAKEVVVHDSHGFAYRNILFDKIHPEAQLIAGQPVILFETEDLKRSPDAAFLIGYHTGLGQEGILSHTYSAKNFIDFKVNGESVDEVQIATALCGYFGIPVVLISGDDVMCNKTKKWLKNIETAIVKYVINRYTARCLSLEKTQNIIKTAAEKALRRIKEFTPFTYTGEITLEVICANTYIATTLEKIPGVKYDGRLTVSYTSSDFLEIYNLMHPIIYISAFGEDPFI